MRCSTPDLPIAIFIQWKSNLQVGLCKPCWERFCDNKKDFEWGDDLKIENFQQWLEKGRGLEGVIPTEYMGRGKWRMSKKEKAEEEISSHGLDRPIEEEEIEDELSPEEES